MQRKSCEQRWRADNIVQNPTRLNVCYTIDAVIIPEVITTTLTTSGRMRSGAQPETPF